jgi:hypothetical protein
MKSLEEMSRRFSADLTLVHAHGPEALARSPRPFADPELPEEAEMPEADAALRIERLKLRELRCGGL